jgi:anthranilate phosphoribosyltransferase
LRCIDIVGIGFACFAPSHHPAKPEGRSADSQNWVAAPLIPTFLADSECPNILMGVFRSDLVGSHRSTAWQLGNSSMRALVVYSQRDSGPDEIRSLGAATVVE